MDKRGIIKLAIILGVLLVGGFFIFMREYEKANSQMANPASEYCVKQGYELEIRDEEDGQVGYCVFPNGKECEEWKFYRGDCLFEKEIGCVPAQCCHSTSCVLKSEAPSCEGIFCTMECKGGTMDCGAGYCDFVDGKCEVIWNE